MFSSETGGPLDTNNVRKRAYHRALEKAGLRQVRIHDLRHGFATPLLQQGEGLAYVRDWSVPQRWGHIGLTHPVGVE